MCRNIFALLIMLILISFVDETMDKIAKKIVNGLDKVEGNFLGKDIQFLAVDIDEVPDIQVASVPSLIYFKNGDPIVYEENLMNEEAIRAWVDAELKSNLDVIEDLNKEQIDDLMEENEYVMIYLCKSQNISPFISLHSFQTRTIARLVTRPSSSWSRLMTTPTRWA